MKRIYVLKERWVLIGTESGKTTEKTIHTTDTSVIRVWGTTAGLGQIALDGPTTETKLDKCGDTSFPRESVLFSIDCRV